MLQDVRLTWEAHCCNAAHGSGWASIVAHVHKAADGHRKLDGHQGSLDAVCAVARPACVHPADCWVAMGQSGLPLCGISVLPATGRPLRATRYAADYSCRQGAAPLADAYSSTCRSSRPARQRC